MASYSKYLLSEYEIKKIIDAKVKENPDILYYIDDYYLQQVISSIIDGVAEAISQSNEKLISNIERMLNDEARKKSFRSGIRI
ncbi:hypothetical protein ACTXHP_04950 [Bacillus stercoris]|uniref:hypothetical protein n=1 Tax=Bacillus subtilis group TaxID=653685 RepID=UPI000A1011C4|nr:hypothetical protein [Bacillus inaquosorum]ARV43919.1 hypothetical protein BCV50_02410 [Bacillus subtilis]WNW24275.1 hypothetical protein RS399_21800 [Bacillus inaquosorum]